MKKKLSPIMTALVLIVVAAGVYLLFRHKEPNKWDYGLQVHDAADKTASTAGVETVSAREGVISDKLPVYGSVIPAAGGRRIVSVPFESQVLDIYVNQGQKVSRGDNLIEIQPSPATMLQFEQAKDAFKIEQQDLEQMERRFNLKLATNEQLLQVKQKLEAARTKLENLKKRGIGGKKKIGAQTGGLIRKVDVQQGNIVPAGQPLIEIVVEGQLQILLGVEPEDIKRVQPGQPVLLTHVNIPGAPVVTGQVQRLSYEVNPSTRLVDVFVTISSPPAFLPGETIYGQIEVGSAQGLIVPRSAVVPEGSQSFVFIIRNNIAHKRYVRIVLETATEYVISGEGVSAGDRVVSLGNYELKDGMEVNVKAAQ